MRACNLVINSFFSGYSDENTLWKSAEDDDFREVKTANIEIAEQPVCIAFQLYKEECPDIKMVNGKVKKLYNDSELIVSPTFYIEKKSKKNSRNLVSGLKLFKDYSSTLQKNSHYIIDNIANQENALPLFAYFTTEDIHSIRKFDKEKKNFKKYPQKPSFGYIESHDCRGLLNCWLKRLLVLKEGHKGEQEIECVRNAIKSALGDTGCKIIKDLLIQVNDNNVYFLYCDGREVRSDLLSDGYRRLVSIVIDLAFRCAILNKVKYKEEAHKYTHGTVIIDEIDEHLHPELQVRIMNALHQTFPKLQFIVSTHAPLVMSSVEYNENNVVYKLEFKDGKYIHKELNTYGLDATTIMDAYMGNITRDLTVAEKLNSLFTLIDEEKYQDARKELNYLKQSLSNNFPEFAKAEAILSFMED